MQLGARTPLSGAELVGIGILAPMPIEFGSFEVLIRFLPLGLDEIWLTPKSNSNSRSFAGRKELGRIPRLVFGYFPYVFRREMRRAGVVAPGGSGGLGTREIGSSFDKNPGTAAGRRSRHLAHWFHIRPRCPLDLL